MAAWSTPELKLYNKEMIRAEIQKNGTCTKSQIARLTSLSVATCNTAINEMLKEKEILKVDQEELQMGRPADRFCYNRDYFHAAGIFLGDEHNAEVIEYAVADAEGRELFHDRRQMQEIRYQDVEDIVSEMMERDPLIRSLSIGIPGITRDGVVERCDIESIVGADLEGWLHSKFGIEVEARNDMDFMVYGAYHTIYRGSQNMAAMFFPAESKGKGVMGCGFMVNGRILRGHTKFAGELSYIMEGFGISREQQTTYWGDRDIFLTYVAQMVLIIIATLDPEEIVIMGNNLTDDEIPAIQEYCKKIVTEQHIPKMEVGTDYEKDYINGLLKVAINKISFPISNPV